MPFAHTYDLHQLEKRVEKLEAMSEREPPWSEIPTRAELRAEIKRLKAVLREISTRESAWHMRELARAALEGKK